MNAEQPDQTRLLFLPSNRHNWSECIDRDFLKYHMCWDNDLILLEYCDGGLLLSWDWCDGIRHMGPISTYDGFSEHCFSAVELDSLEPKLCRVNPRLCDSQKVLKAVRLVHLIQCSDYPENSRLDA